MKAQRDVSPDPSTTTNFFGASEVFMKLTVRYEFNNHMEINPEAKRRAILKMVLMIELGSAPTRSQSFSKRHASPTN